MSDRTAVLSVIWACVSSWYYGYHLSELNFPVNSLTCITPAYPPPSRLPLCLDLDSTRYSIVTAVFTVGGLVGSLISSWVVEKEGIKGGISWTGYLNLVGVLGMGIAPHWLLLVLGRFIVGVSSGIAICLVPPYLSMVAKSSPELASKSGQIGTMNQLAIVLGICSAQISGLLLTGEKGDIPGSWRYVVAISGIVAAVQIATASQIVAPNEKGTSSSDTSATIFDERDADCLLHHPAASPLLSTSTPTPAKPTEQLNLHSILGNPSLRGPAILVAAFMAIQQLSGVNAVMFYSTPVLRPLLPTSAGVVGVGITVVNAIMTLPAIFLMDRLGRKTLLLTSIAGMGITSTLLAVGLNGGHQTLSAFSIITFIASFSIGLGPVPFLLVSELVPSPAIPAVSSLSLSINWITNFFIAILFLPLRDFLSTPVDPRDPQSDRRGEGRVFYVFTGILVVGGLLVWRGLRPGK
uniref:Vacuolar membrane protein n=1 Tax=Kwoniella bestiolae CBS 10118 TaxID=1296100 RepID=A0A1B9G0Z6_9TREE|nr:vacuolar membrane protein [Kwoniella bestiolae CBS 10118]OCF24695.1 vacuolar membrane protein [Kwoniella bestiolae CBS 10118]